MSTKHKVVITDCDFGDLEDQLQVLESMGVKPVVLQAWDDEERVIAECRDADAVLNQYAQINRRVLSAMERCRIVVRYGIGVDTIDVPAATELGIYVANVPDYGVDEVANHAMAMILACARRLFAYDRGVKAGLWGYKIGKPVLRLKGQTLGLLSFGRIARDVAAKAKGFGLEILAFDPLLPDRMFEEHGARRAASVEEVLRRADFLSVHSPLPPETRHLIGERELKMMKPTAYLINTSRGAVVDEAAVYRALSDGWIAGAALDVLETEPVSPGNPLLGLENVILTPHAAFYSEESLRDLQRKAAEEVARVLRGEKPKSPVNRSGSDRRCSPG